MSLSDVDGTETIAQDIRAIRQGVAEMVSLEETESEKRDGMVKTRDSITQSWTRFAPTHNLQRLRKIK